MLRRFVQVLLFLMLVDEGSALYKGYMFAPFAWVHPVLFAPVVGVRPFDALLLLIVVAASRAKTGAVGPMRRTLVLAALVTVAGFLHGVGMGGDARAACWQVYHPIATILEAFAFAAAFHTGPHFVGLAKAVVAA